MCRDYRRRAPVEPLEDEWQLPGADPHPRVADRDHRPLVSRLHAHLHPPQRRGELERVREEVVDHLGQPRLVAHDRRDAGGPHHERDAPLLRRRPRALDALRHQRGGIHLQRGPGGLQNVVAVERLGARQRSGDERATQRWLTILLGAAHQVQIAEMAPLQDSPARSDEPVESIKLVPMGAARLRISARSTSALATPSRPSA